jgi:hypothetical protein
VAEASLGGARRLSLDLEGLRRFLDLLAMMAVLASRPSISFMPGEDLSAEVNHFSK